MPCSYYINTVWCRKSAFIVIILRKYLWIKRFRWVMVAIKLSSLTDLKMSPNCSNNELYFLPASSDFSSRSCSDRPSQAPAAFFEVQTPQLNVFRFSRVSWAGFSKNLVYFSDQTPQARRHYSSSHKIFAQAFLHCAQPKTCHPERSYRSPLNVVAHQFAQITKWCV